VLNKSKYIFYIGFFKVVATLCLDDSLAHSWQLTGFLDVYSILSGIPSATLKVLNDVTITIDSKQHWAAIFIDLVKAFDMVDHSILVGRLRSIGVSKGVFGLVC
jgi:hypothetical protein